MRRLAIIAIALAGRAAAADPAIDHVVTIPTAWLPGEGVAIGSASLDHRGGGSIVVGYGLGRIAAVEVADDTAAFRLGARQDAWFGGQPAVVVGVTASLPGEPRVAQAYVVASRELGPLRVHAGVAALDAEHAGVRLGATVRPLAGLELVPPLYPRTTIVGDIQWQPELARPAPAARWVLGYGVRYQALAWGSIELAVRVRQDDGIGGSTVLVRVNGVWRP